GRRGDEYAAGPGGEVPLGLRAPRAPARALEHQVDPQLGPGQERPVAVPIDGDLLPVHVQLAGADADAAREGTIVRVELQQERVGPGTGGVIDRDDIEGEATLPGCPQGQPPD